MNIGIITVHNSPNYGASLQSYALWKYIDNLPDCHCEIIDLYRPYQKEYVKSNKYKACREKQLSSFSRFKIRLKSTVKRVLHYHVPKPRKFFSDRALRKFNEFNGMVSLSRPYYGPDELYANPPIYDLYVSGSDQLWNPEQPWCLEPYFLTFAPRGARKISFASSFGVTELKDGEKRNIANWLKEYNSISVREQSAKNLLSTMGIKSTVVSDPTFLLGQEYWSSIAIKPKQSDYILLFTLNVEPKIKEYAIRLAEESGKKLIVLSQYDTPSPSYTLVDDAGPRDFIGYIANAGLVITNSFHGTVFSILMGANNFFTYIDPSNTRGSRIIDLLSTYNLKDHLLKTDLSQSYSDLQGLKIEKDKLEELVNKEVKGSRKFLNNSIGV